MILKETLKKIARSQFENLDLQNETVERELLKKIKISTPFAIFITGIRRCGKSTLMKQIMKKTSGFHYFNFEDPRIISFEQPDFIRLEESLIEEFGSSNDYFFDEIQNVAKWEKFIRYLLDKKKNIVLTGSNETLLNIESGTKLTGRYLRYELFPFSYKEYLILNNLQPDLVSFEKFIYSGGFPEYLKAGNEEILQELFKDIIYRDIVSRYKIRNIKTLQEIATYLISNIGKEYSYNKLKNVFNLGSVNSVISYISHFEDSYLLFSIPKFEFSIKKQVIGRKKIYAIDNGLVNANAISFSKDIGWLLENIVYLELRRKYREIFYHSEKNECDFILKEKTRITKAVQVCFAMDDANKDREINGLLEAIIKFNLTEGLILTYDQEDILLIDDRKIIIKPVWKWLSN